MIKNFLIGFGLLCVVAVGLLGTRGEHHAAPPIEFFGDMKRQSKVKFQKPSDFFADGRAARPPVDGTIPIGYDIPGHPFQNAGAPNDIKSPLGEFTAGTDYYNTGKMGENWGTGMPEQIPVTADLFRGVRKNLRLIVRSVTELPGKGMESLQNTVFSVSPTITRISTGKWQMVRSSIP